MSVIVTDSGFHPDDWLEGFADPADTCAGTTAVDLAPESDPDTLELTARIVMIRVNFPSFADGRGFTIARSLRRRGYTGRLRACGHVIADQYAMARRSGFDEVEISDDLAARQSASQWQSRADWRAHDYQARLRSGS